MPVYGHPKRGYNIEQIIDILLNPSFETKFLCKTNPISVQNNVSFVVDLARLSNPNDVRADDLGVWKCTGSRSLRFLVKLDDKSCTVVSKHSPTDETVVHIRRQYHVHGTDSDFHRMIAFVESYEGTNCMNWPSLFV